MKLAIVGSRSIMQIDINRYLPKGITEIVSGGACGIDTLAKKYAVENKIIITEFLPKYNMYGKAAPIKRNEEIAEYADEAIAFWDGCSKGTLYTIKAFHKRGKRVTIIKISSN